MPIMASHDLNDARDTTHLLASMALRCIDEPESGPDQDVALNNVFRLLESYRTNTLVGVEYPPFLPQNEADADVLDMQRSASERHLEDVQDAIAVALAAAFIGSSRDEAILKVENVVRALALPPPRRYSADELRQATTFFRQLVEKLAVAE